MLSLKGWNSWDQIITQLTQREMDPKGLPAALPSSSFCFFFAVYNWLLNMKTIYCQLQWLSAEHADQQKVHLPLTDSTVNPVDPVG